MKGTVRRARRKVGAIRRRLFEPPEQAAWRRAWHQAETTPRFTPGTIRMMDYDLRYSDLLSFCFQWQDIFVKRVLAFESDAPTPPRILDCGANVGLASLFFRRLFPDARITAFEADPSVFGMLDANLKANGADRVTARHAALWTSTGSLTFRCEGSDSGMIASLPGAVAGTSTTVPSFGCTCSPRAVDLLKLDIEGAEDAVMTASRSFITSGAVMDLHEFDPATPTPRVLERLTRAGFTCAIDGFVPLVWRSRCQRDDAAPSEAMQWAMTVVRVALSARPCSPETARNGDRAVWRSRRETSQISGTVNCWFSSGATSRCVQTDGAWRRVGLIQPLATTVVFSPRSAAWSACHRTVAVSTLASRASCPGLFRSRGRRRQRRASAAATHQQSLLSRIIIPLQPFSPWSTRSAGVARCR